MPETLKVNGFLSLPATELTIHPITVVIGPQATGKSVLAKLVFFFREFPSFILSALEENSKKRQLDALIINRFREYFPASSWRQSDFSIHYSIDEHWIKIDATNTASGHKVELDYSEWYVNEFRRLKTIFKRASESSPEASFNFADTGQFRANKALTNAIDRDFPTNYPQRQVFAPAGRAFFALLQSGIFSFLSSNNAIDPFLQRFGAYYENLKRQINRPPMRRFGSAAARRVDRTKEIEKLVNEIICGEYSSEKGKDFLHVSGGRKIGLATASSGQQEALPLALLLKIEAQRALEFRAACCLTIEEPEAHLFPRAQRSIVELIATIYRMTDGRTRFIITTHSPYVLTALNNIAYAARTAASTEGHNTKKLREIFPESQILPPDIIHAYALSTSDFKSIMEPDYGLIDANEIDKVSHELAVDFEKLLSHRE